MIAGNGRILVRDGKDGPWTSPETQAYREEKHLEEILLKDPAQVPGVPVGSIAVDQFDTAGGGTADICIVSLAGDITIVECKLASNTEHRRRKIGQVLDYASAIASMASDEFLLSFEHRGHRLDSLLEPSALARLRANIRAGKFDLCLAVDRIDDDLRRMVEYLNRITIQDVVVSALQLAYAKHGSLEILVPSTFGGELSIEKHRTGSAVEGQTRWTKDEFLLAAPAEDRPKVQKLFDLASASGVDGVEFGLKPIGAVFLRPGGLKKSPLQLWISKRGEAFVQTTRGLYNDRNGAGYRSLGEVLRQDCTQPMRGVPLASFDTDALWEATVLSAEAINALDYNASPQSFVDDPTDRQSGADDQFH